MRFSPHIELPAEIDSFEITGPMPELLGLEGEQLLPFIKHPSHPLIHVHFKDGSTETAKIEPVVTTNAAALFTHGSFWMRDEKWEFNQDSFNVRIRRITEMGS